MSAPLTVLAIDDEPLALKRVEIILGQIPGFTLIGTADGCAAGLRAALELKPDILLLDIRMRDGSGLDVLQGLGAVSAPATIFVTAFDTFAVRAFDLNALDYVLKPIDLQRLREALARARDRIKLRQSASAAEEMRHTIADLRSQLAENRSGSAEQDMWIRTVSGALTRVSLEDVIWISSEDDYIRLHLKDRSYLVRLSIKAFEAGVAPGRFVRIHRRTLVRISAVRDVLRDRSGARVRLMSGQVLDCGRVYARSLAALFKPERLT
jgi:two-component system LytT family response regulator